MTASRLALALIGPTASGKTAFALEIAEKVQGEIVCMDSTTVYKGFDIGSSKPTQEERERIPHHLLDILEPADGFSAFHFVQRADEIINEIAARGKTPIVVGGTYFYLRALQHGMYPTPVIPTEVLEAIEREHFEDEGLNTAKMHDELKAQDAKAAAAIHPHDRYRLVRALAILRTTQEAPSALTPTVLSESQKNRLWMKYAMTLSRHTLNKNIVARTEKMLEGGLVDEARRLVEKYPQSRALKSIGYAEACAFLSRKLTEKQLRNEIVEKTRQLAKRQLTWLRSDPEVRYVDARDGDRIALEVANLRVALGEAA